jgi:hypothetical protein
MRKYDRWTIQEINYLKKNYGKILMKEIIKKLKRSKHTIYQKAINKFNLHSNIGFNLWTQEEINYLKKNYGKITAQKIANKLGRTRTATKTQAQKLKLPSESGRKRWNKKEIDYLKENYGKIYTKEIAEKLGKSKESVSLKAHTLKLYSELGGKRWNKKEIKLLKKNYGKIKVKIISKFLKRKKKSVLDKAYFLGLKSNLTCEGNKVSSKARKKISLGMKKSYEENPNIKRRIGLAVKKRWQNPKYMKRMKIIRKKMWKKNPNYKLTQSRYKNLRFAKKININIAYLLGCLCGDGFIADYHKYKTPSYYIKLRVKDYNFAMKFKKNIEKWLRKKAKIGIDDYPFLSCKMYNVIFYSKKVTLFLKELRINVKKVILNSNKKCQIAFLEGMYDSEGSVSLNYYNGYANKTISFCNTNKTNIYLIQNILNSFEIQTHLHKEKKKYNKRKRHYYKRCYYIKIYKQENFIKFYNLINFSIKYKQDKLKQLANLYRI